MHSGWSSPPLGMRSCGKSFCLVATGRYLFFPTAVGVRHSLSVLGFFSFFSWTKMSWHSLLTVWC